MYYLCSKNKDADQLRGYREADLRLCFRPCKLLVFSRTGSIQSSTCIICKDRAKNFVLFFFSYQMCCFLETNSYQRVIKDVILYNIEYFVQFCINIVYTGQPHYNAIF